MTTRRTRSQSSGFAAASQMALVRLLEDGQIEHAATSKNSREIDAISVFAPLILLTLPRNGFRPLRLDSRFCACDLPWQPHGFLDATGRCIGGMIWYDASVANLLGSAADQLRSGICCVCSSLVRFLVRSAQGSYCVLLSVDWTWQRAPFASLGTNLHW